MVNRASHTLCHSCSPIFPSNTYQGPYGPGTVLSTGYSTLNRIVLHSPGQRKTFWKQLSTPIIISLSPTMPAQEMLAWERGKTWRQNHPTRPTTGVILHLCFPEHAPPDTLPLLHLAPPGCLLPLTWPLEFQTMSSHSHIQKAHIPVSMEPLTTGYSSKVSNERQGGRVAG